MESQHLKCKYYILLIHHTNYQKRKRLTFVDDYFDEKWE